MADYNTKNCRLLYEKHGEVGISHFIKHFFTDGVKSHFKNFYSIKTWQSDFLTPGVFEMIYSGLKNLVLGVAMAIFLMAATLTGPVWIPFVQIKKAAKAYSAYQRFLEEEITDSQR